MRQPVPFGKYLLLDRISVGGMAEVFKAKSYGVEGFEKIIAIKRILPTMGEDRDFIKMFIDEAKIAGQLAHANICQIFELGRIDGSHFIAMEYIWGKDLLQIQNRLRKTKQMMPVPMACFALAKVLEGLDYAHRKRDPLGRPLEIVHRDCSPQNVLVSYEGEVKIIDFGIAKATSRNSRTMAGVLKGKFGYMSPEQVRGLPLDRRSDVFALGTMLYECLTGERLFHGETDFSTLEKVRNVDIRRPRELNPNIPDAVERIILRALAKDVDERYQWCSEMLADVQQYLMSQDVVFTAKSLSTWLKDVFAAEIERERQLLEQYKRVGRDGHVAGATGSVKQAVLESFGETPAPEGDPTTLGTPTFDDVESGVVAPPAGIGPAPGSPAAIGINGAHTADEEYEEFQEEAPTEIYGEIDHPLRPSGGFAPAVGRQSGSHSSARPTKPPPRPSAVIQATTAAAPLSPAPPARPSQPAFAAVADEQPAAPPVTPSPALPSGHKTLLGAPAPIVPSHLPSMAATPPPQPHILASTPIQPAGGQPHGFPPQGFPPPSYPPEPSAAQPPEAVFAPAREPAIQSTGIHTPVPTTSVHAPVPPAPAQLTRRPSLGRDIAIGVGIAIGAIAVFLLVKMLVIDGDRQVAPPSTIATIAMELPRNVAAKLYIDGKLVRNVINGTEIPVNAGERRIRLVGGDGAECEQAVKLPAGKTININCPLQPKAQPVPPPSPAPAPAPSDPGATTAASRDAGVVDPKAVKPKARSQEPASPSDQMAWDMIDGPDKHGYLQIYSKPSARIFIDDKDTGMSTPITGKKLAVEPGTRRVQFVIGKDKFTFKVDVKAGAIETLNKDLQ
ncbi:MAG: protein kinase [Kofleriaceae bacterium]